MEKKAAVPMSKGPKRVIAACIVGLLVCALLFLEQIIVGNGDAGMYLGLALSSAASAGLLGRVAWGRFLFSVISVLFAFSLPGIFGPPLPDKVGTSLLEKIFGVYPATWIGWTITMVAVLACLLPATIIGLDRDWFRDQKW